MGLSAESLLAHNRGVYFNFTLFLCVCVCVLSLRLIASREQSRAPEEFPRHYEHDLGAFMNCFSAFGSLWKCKGQGVGVNLCFRQSQSINLSLQSLTAVLFRKSAWFVRLRYGI